MGLSWIYANEQRQTERDFSKKIENIKYSSKPSYFRIPLENRITRQNLRKIFTNHIKY